MKQRTETSGSEQNSPSVRVALAGCWRQRLLAKSCFSPLASSLQNPATTNDLISFLKTLPDCRMRREARFSQ